MHRSDLLLNVLLFTTGFEQLDEDMLYCTLAWGGAVNLLGLGVYNFHQT